MRKSGRNSRSRRAEIPNQVNISHVDFSSAGCRGISVGRLESTFNALFWSISVSLKCVIVHPAEGDVTNCTR